MGNESNIVAAMMEELKMGGVFVVTKIRPTEPNKVIGAFMSLDACAAAIIDDGDWFLDGYRVTVADRDMWLQGIRFKDEYAGHSVYGFQRGEGMLTALWNEQETPYRVQWTSLAFSYSR